MDVSSYPRGRLGRSCLISLHSHRLKGSRQDPNAGEEDLCLKLYTDTKTIYYTLYSNRHLLDLGGSSTQTVVLSTSDPSSLRYRYFRELLLLSKSFPDFRIRRNRSTSVRPHRPSFGRDRIPRFQSDLRESLLPSLQRSIPWSSSGLSGLQWGRRRHRSPERSSRQVLDWSELYGHNST